MAFYPVYVHEPNFKMIPIDIDPFDDGMVPIDEWEPNKESWFVTASDEMPQHVIDSLRLQSTSFNNECRAYGRLKELGREDLAIKAHGYLRVPLHQIEERLQAMLQNNEEEAWTLKDLMELEEVGTPDANVPFMAIVKDWILDHRTSVGGMTREAEQRQIKHLPRMLRNLRQLHKCGIVVRDLKDQQYYDGQLGDLSFAWTIPHVFGPEGGIRPRWAFASMAAWDLKCFQTLLDRANRSALRAEPPLKTHNLVAWRNDEVYQRLRPRPEMLGPFLPMLHYDDEDVQGNYDMTHYPPYDPSLFNWKASQKRATEKKYIGGISKKKPTGGVSKKRSKGAISKKRKSADTGEAKQANKGKRRKRRR
ncbi:hypothetical protein IL306_003447 [Fusarium sp. DS 682]|nr:hypothetical protein IL306_003447 [Fusarium sp. DS 682]